MEEKAEPKPLTVERIGELADVAVTNENMYALMSVHTFNIALIIEMTPPEFVNSRVYEYIFESLRTPR